jgi:hypothetical protein
MAIYGHRHLNLFFRPVVEVNDRGLRYRGREYSWNTISKVEVHDSPFDPNLMFTRGAGYPWATVHLSDGERIRLNGRTLEKQGAKPEVDFFSGKSGAFQELIVAFKMHRVATITPSAREIVLFHIKIVATVLLGILVIYAILGYFDARL